LSYVSELLTRLHDLLNEGDLTQAAKEVHNLVSTSGNVGATRLSDLARAHEHTCKSGDLEEARRCADALFEAADDADAALRKWVESSSSAA
jgi:HPt (histidine-containing phosphotransfer) domain-containing protein